MIREHVLALKMHCLAIASLIDIILQDDDRITAQKAAPVVPEKQVEQEKDCAHDDLTSISVMGNPGLQYCKQCGATVNKTAQEE